MPSMSADNLKHDISSPAKVYLWDVVFGKIVGGGDRDHLEVRAQSTAIPGRSFGNIVVPYKGTAGFQVPGKIVMTHLWPAVFIEGNDRAVFDAVYGWMQYIANARRGTGGSVAIAKADVYLRLMNQAGTITNKFRLAGCYPQAMDEVPLAYDDEGNIMYATMWSYDYWEDDN